jgi:hypothetical protein
MQPTNEDPTRWRLSLSGYSYDGGRWTKPMGRREHVARADHMDGSVRRGDHYTITLTRLVDDTTGATWITQTKTVTS